jgi:glycerol-3-phosphate dehydrogenase
MGEPLKPQYGRGFIYSDGWVDDSRLVALNAVGAAEAGAAIHTRTRVLQARREDGLWRLAVRADGGASRTVSGRVLVNAAGPWVETVRSLTDNRAGGPAVRLVKGSHIVVPRLFEGEHAYILQNPDRRIVFAIPYEGQFTLIGTTDEVFESDPDVVEISPAEIDYLCESINAYFERTVSAKDVLWTYAGVRPLFEDHAANASKVTRDYVLDVEDAGGAAPILSVYGGKITTYRRLAEHALEKLTPWLGPAASAKAGWTKYKPLPGGDIDRGTFTGTLLRAYPFLSSALADRLIDAYGSRALDILAGATSMADLGHHFGAGLTDAEVRWLIAVEWATSAEDVLWRRSKLGLHMTPTQRQDLETWFNTLGRLEETA